MKRNHVLNNIWFWVRGPGTLKKSHDLKRYGHGSNHFLSWFIRAQTYNLIRIFFDSWCIQNVFIYKNRFIGHDERVSQTWRPMKNVILFNVLEARPTRRKVFKKWLLSLLIDIISKNFHFKNHGNRFIGYDGRVSNVHIEISWKNHLCGHFWPKKKKS